MVLVSSDWWGCFFLWVLMVKWLLVLWGFSGFSGFLMVLMVWNVIPVRQSIRGLRQWSPTKLPSVVVEERWREKDIVRQCMYSKCVCVGKCFCGCNDVDGPNWMYVVQTANESCDSTITGYYRNTKPNLSFLWVTFSACTNCTHPYINIQIHICTLKPQLPSFTYEKTSLSQQNHYVLPRPQNTPMTVYQPIQPFTTPRHPVLCRCLPMAKISLLWWPIKC